MSKRTIATHLARLVKCEPELRDKCDRDKLYHAGVEPAYLYGKRGRSTI
ncbi:MAG: hypothetical protein M3N42_16570 [Cyanobacteriota bacterium]|nr:hypothetical protein [Cyanobacteriota bacterium]